MMTPWLDPQLHTYNYSLIVCILKQQNAITSTDVKLVQLK